MLTSSWRIAYFLSILRITCFLSILRITCFLSILRINYFLSMLRITYFLSFSVPDVSVQWLISLTEYLIKCFIQHRQSTATRSVRHITFTTAYSNVAINHCVNILTSLFADASIVSMHLVLARKYKWVLFKWALIIIRKIFQDIQKKVVINIPIHIKSD